MLLCVPPMLHILVLRFLHIFACSSHSVVFFFFFFRKEHTTICSFFSIERGHILNGAVLISGKFSVERERKFILLKQKYCHRCDIKTCCTCLILSQYVGREMYTTSLGFFPVEAGWLEGSEAKLLRKGLSL